MRQGNIAAIQVIEESVDHESGEEEEGEGEAVLTPGDKIDFLFF